MALVLRKAVLPRNVSLLKCMKGRPLATAANRTNASVVLKLAPRLTVKDEVTAKLRNISGMKKKNAALPVQETVKTTGCLLRKSVSCPCLLPSRIHEEFPNSCHCQRLRRSHSATVPNQRHVHEYPTSNPNVTIPSSFRFYTLPMNSNGSPKWCEIATDNSASHMMHQLCNVAAATCPAPCCGPCCGCCRCLPPPCNTPPRCMQYMTGYYYYPYGFWFCGPYHVTGTCTPVGPCAPGGPCGPCAPCPGGPCGPCGPGCVCGIYNTPLGQPSPTDSKSTKNPKLDYSKIFDVYSKLCCFPLSLTPSKPSQSILRKMWSLNNASRNYACCGPCGCVGPCGPSGPCGPYGPCGPGYPGMSCNFYGCGCGPCGCGPCGCGPCCGPCGCGPCGCGPCGCGPCGCGPCSPCVSPWCGCGSCCGCGPCCGPCGPCCGSICCRPCGPCGRCGPCCGPCGCGPCPPYCRPGCGPCAPCCRPSCCCIMPNLADSSFMTGMSSLPMPAMSLPPMPAMSLPPMPAMSLPPMPTMSLPPVPAMSLPQVPTLSLPPMQWSSAPCPPWPPFISQVPEVPDPSLATPTSGKDAKDVCFCTVCRDKRAGKQPVKSAARSSSDNMASRPGINPHLIRRYPYNAAKLENPSSKLNRRTLPSVSLILTAYFSTLTGLTTMFSSQSKSITVPQTLKVEDQLKNSPNYCCQHHNHFCDDCILGNPNKTDACRNLIPKKEVLSSLPYPTMPMNTMCPNIIGCRQNDQLLGQSVTNPLAKTCLHSKEA